MVNERRNHVAYSRADGAYLIGYGSYKGSGMISRWVTRAKEEAGK